MLRVRKTPPPPPTDETTVPTQGAQTLAPQNKTATTPAPPAEPEAPQINLSNERLNFFLSSRYKDSLDGVKEDFKISQADSNFISDLDRLVLAGDMDLEAYLLAIEDEIKLDPILIKKLQAKLLAQRFLPLDDDLHPTASEVAKTHELDLPKTEYYKVYKRPLTYSGAVSEIAEMVGLTLLSGDVRTRLRELIIARIKDQQITAQLLEVMTRGEEFGGLGFDKKTASSAVAAIEDILDRTEIISEEQYSEWLAKETARASKRAGAKGVEAHAMRPEEHAMRQEEVENIKNDLKKRKVAVETILSKAVEDALKRISYKPPSPYLARRFKNAISSRLRSVRSQADFRDILMRPEKVGGVGLKKDVASKVSKEIEVIYKEYYDEIASDEKKRLDEQIIRQKTKVEERRKKESEEHAKWFEEKIRRGKGLQGIQPGQIAPPNARPKIDSVQHDRPQLMGLLGELASISRDDFRRIGDTPKESVLGIRKKIDTVSAESYEQRIRAYEAFRQSPIQKEYLEIVGKSFKEKKPVAEVAKELRAKGKDGLSPEEIAAIIQLNSTLQY